MMRLVNANSIPNINHHRGGYRPAFARELRRQRGAQVPIRTGLSLKLTAHTAKKIDLASVAIDPPSLGYLKVCPRAARILRDGSVPFKMIERNCMFVSDTKYVALFETLVSFIPLAPQPAHAATDRHTSQQRTADELIGRLTVASTKPQSVSVAERAIERDEGFMVFLWSRNEGVPEYGRRICGAASSTKMTAN